MTEVWILVAADLVGGPLVEQVLRPDLYPDGGEEYAPRPVARPAWPTRAAAEAELERVAGHPFLRVRTFGGAESDHVLTVRGTGPARRYRAVRHEVSAP